VNTARLVDIYGTDREAISEIFGLFVRMTGPQLETLRHAVQERDMETVLTVAHTLKGSAGNMGAEELAELLQKTEEAVKATDWAQALSLHAQIMEAFSSVREFIEAYGHD
jgi:HPt (histidine-containing phosphotransfer) domain-containing protein